MEGAHVVVLQIDLDEGLPVVVALVQLDAVERVALKAQVLARPHLGQIGGNVPAVVFKEQAVPFAQLVVVEVQAGVVRKVRRTQQFALGRVGPAVQGADDVAARMALALRLQVATVLQHHGLAVAADVGNQFDLALGIANERAALFFLGQGVVVACVGHGEPMAHVTGALLEEDFQFTLEQRLVEVTGNW